MLDFNWIFDSHNDEDSDKDKSNLDKDDDKRGNLFRFMKILTKN